MSQYSFSYNYDSLNDAFNVANRKGKMQKRYLSLEYLAVADEYREMRKELNEIYRKKKVERTEEETSIVDQLKQSMKENAQQQKALLQEHLSKVSLNILSSSFRFNLRRFQHANALTIAKLKNIFIKAFKWTTKIQFFSRTTIYFVCDLSYILMTYIIKRR